MIHKAVIVGLLLGLTSVNGFAAEAAVDPEDKAYCEQSARDEQVPADQLAGYVTECLQMLTTNSSIDEAGDRAYCEQSARDEQVPTDQLDGYVAECLRMLSTPEPAEDTGDKGQN